ncbi:GNAT family N-acetyltransferase [Embleya sp. NPDC050493]|uniref:GNAT family N-acetyltransferase n=1 Tax=Embleya sp. NPDC050493 TaxID=3363989 RepID=UPI0037981755
MHRDTRDTDDASRHRPGTGTGTDIGIRVAVPADEPALARIDRDTWSPQVTPTPPQPPARPFFDPDTPPANVLVAHEGSEVRGFVKIRPSRMAASGHVQYINGFAVDPDHQGRGIGTLLLSAARAEAVRRNARRITLHVLGTNSHAWRLYEKGGYIVEGIARGEFLLDGRYVDSVSMALELVPEPVPERMPERVAKPGPAPGAAPTSASASAPAAGPASASAPALDPMGKEAEEVSPGPVPGTDRSDWP